MTIYQQQINPRSINFIGIGGHACASTKLYELMNAHPQIGFVNPSQESGIDIRGKECHYWDRYSYKSVDWYLSLFKWEYPCVGEITPAYARLDVKTIERIRDTFPDVQVFFIIRDTFERTWSNVKKNLSKQDIKNPSTDWMIAQAKDIKTLLRNDYVTTVQSWKGVYGERFHVILFEDFILNTRRIMIKIAKLLNVNYLFYQSLNNEILLKKTNPTLELKVPEEFKKWYKDNNQYDWNKQLKTIRTITSFF